MLLFCLSKALSPPLMWHSNPFSAVKQIHLPLKLLPQFSKDSIRGGKILPNGRSEEEVWKKAYPISLIKTANSFLKLTAVITQKNSISYSNSKPKPFVHLKKYLSEIQNFWFYRNNIISPRFIFFSFVNHKYLYKSQHVYENQIAFVFVCISLFRFAEPHAAAWLELVWSRVLQKWNLKYVRLLKPYKWKIGLSWYLFYFHFQAVLVVFAVYCRCLSQGLF